MSITVLVCPHCFSPYALDLQGTKDGCDTCLGNIRDEDGTIVSMDFSTVFADDEDALTDMEKA